MYIYIHPWSKTACIIMNFKQTTHINSIHPSVRPSISAAEIRGPPRLRLVLLEPVDELPGQDGIGALRGVPRPVDHEEAQGQRRKPQGPETACRASVARRDAHLEINMKPKRTGVSAAKGVASTNDGLLASMKFHVSVRGCIVQSPVISP